MPFIFSYLLKLSLSLSVVYLFYQLALRRLTFYNWNRFYLLCYTVLSFFIPFINITTLLEQNEMMNNKVVQLIPQVGEFNVNNSVVKSGIAGWTKWDFVLLVLFSGFIIMLVRLLVQLLSFKKIMSNAELLSNNDVKLYQVNGSIIPFSFGNSIFINQQLHNDSDLQEIIRHEFVHVRQKHTLDIIWSELLCMLNWYNPFVWMIRKAIRQNLEFIADNKVLQTGFDKKQYQYLLLKVTGNNHFSIASQFNFSSLKKRIAMMNKMKSAKAHLIKFLFVLPLMAILLVAFRNDDKRSRVDKVTSPAIVNEKEPALNESERLVANVNDTIPGGSVNSKGYFVEITGEKGNRAVIVKDKNQKEVKRLLLTDWNQKSNYYQYMYGPLPVDPKEAIAVNPDKVTATYEVEDQPAIKDFKRLELNDDLIATVAFTNGAIEKYDLNKEADKKVFEKKYGPVISALPKGDIKPVTIVRSSVSYSSPEKIAVAVSPDKIGVSASATTTKSADAYIATAPENSPAVEVIEIAEPVSPFTGIDNINGNLLLDIRGNTPAGKVKEMASALKNQGYDVTINTLEYRDGKIALLKGTISDGSRKNNFEAADFLRFAISDVKKEDGKKEFNFYVGSGNLTWQ